MYDPGYQGDEFVWPTYGYNNMSDEELNHVKLLYAGEITFVDKWFGRILEKMDELDLWKDTTLIITTDHGFMFGEHGIVGKPHAALSDSNLYRELNHIPLIIKMPDAVPRRENKQVTQTVDIFPTILDLAGIKNEFNTDGESLRGYLEGRSRPHESLVVFGRFAETIGITDGNYVMYVWPKNKQVPCYWYGNEPPKFLSDYYNVVGEPELANGELRYKIELKDYKDQVNALYDVKGDPHERVNLFGRNKELTEKMLSMLHDKLKSMGCPEEVFRRYEI